MTVRAVAFNGTRVNASDANTNWAKVNAGGGSPAAEAPIAYQNSLAVNVKNNNAAPANLGGIEYDPASGAVDMTAAANRLMFVKAIVSDSFDIDPTLGAEIWIGSASTAYYNYVISGTNANLSVYDSYPPQGGYLITAIDPNIAAWREGTTGSPSLTAIDYFAFVAQFVTGQAKSENVALDAIDVGTGLTLTAGTGADPDGNFVDFVDVDQDITTNRWGVVVGTGDNVRAIGLLTIGSATETDFSDDTSIVVFPDGYHSRGLVGCVFDIQNASSVISVGATLIGEGTRNGVDANDTRPDFTVTGTSGSFTFTGQMRNHRDVTFTSVCDVDGADIECHLLVQNSCNLANSTIRTNALTSVACLQDPTFGTTTDLHDCTFVQTGAGHAIEIDTAGTYAFTNLFGMNVAAGYGANTTDSAGLDITAGTGTVTINISGGDTPTYKTAGATVVINNPKTHTVSNLRTSDRVIWIRVSDGAELENLVESSGTAAYSYNYVSDVIVDVQVLSGDNTKKNTLTRVTLGNADSGFPAVQADDRVYFNPT